MKVLKLNDEQEKAFKSLERAYKKCKKANVNFYVVLETLYAINGDYVSSSDISDSDDGPEVDDCIDTTNFIFDWGFSGFADDTHKVRQYVYDEFPCEEES